ncbi:hypothetical protein CDAR_297491 [Caerostris darwini]|uniref:Uncharacterized protein n=1 Tax=Caerostris darwini TaxID=1538125 RepID=A0AAV4PPB3_9ARAC|nr:hypothetical protein CDAR_297491 [Caerostris darwini]
MPPFDTIVDFTKEVLHYIVLLTKDELSLPVIEAKPTLCHVLSAAILQFTHYYKSLLFDVAKEVSALIAKNPDEFYAFGYSLKDRLKVAKEDYISASKAKREFFNENELYFDLIGIFSFICCLAHLQLSAGKKHYMLKSYLMIAVLFSKQVEEFESKGGWKSFHKFCCKYVTQRIKIKKDSNEMPSTSKGNAGKTLIDHSSESNVKTPTTEKYSKDLITKDSNSSNEVPEKLDALFKKSSACSQQPNDTTLKTNVENLTVRTSCESAPLSNLSDADVSECARLLVKAILQPLDTSLFVILQFIRTSVLTISQNFQSFIKRISESLDSKGIELLQIFNLQFQNILRIINSNLIKWFATLSSSLLDMFQPLNASLSTRSKPFGETMAENLLPLENSLDNIFQFLFSSFSVLIKYLDDQYNRNLNPIVFVISTIFACNDLLPWENPRPSSDLLLDRIDTQSQHLSTGTHFAFL